MKLLLPFLATLAIVSLTSCGDSEAKMKALEEEKRKAAFDKARAEELAESRAASKAFQEADIPMN